MLFIVVDIDYSCKLVAYESKMKERFPEEFKFFFIDLCVCWRGIFSF